MIRASWLLSLAVSLATIMGFDNFTAKYQSHHRPPALRSSTTDLFRRLHIIKWQMRMSRCRASQEIPQT